MAGNGAEHTGQCREPGRRGVVHTLGVELAGWPKDIAISRPSKIPAADLRRLVDKLRDGSMAWVSLTKSQREATAVEVEGLRESGAVKKRKPHSDKDKPRGPRAKKNKKKNTQASESEDEEVGEDESEDEDEDEGEDEDDTSRQRAARTSAIPPSITRAPVGHVSSGQLVAPATQASTAAIAAASFPGMSFPSAAPAAETPAAATVVASFPGAFAPVSSVGFRPQFVYDPTFDPFRPQFVYDPTFDPFDFTGMDFDTPLDPILFAPQTDLDFTNDGALWHLNTSNREDGWVNASNSTGTDVAVGPVPIAHVNSGTSAGYEGVGNRGPLMTVFSVMTNTTTATTNTLATKTKKRKRAAGDVDGAEKPVRRARAKKNNEGTSTTAGMGASERPKPHPKHKKKTASAAVPQA
ncbi:hypothetical protein B0H13DRAFT_1869331 [Mycena leptocephala]|nr:hypothetical protein B0H13DRAFT_1869331 [Mycena leptocephala]